ncbi:MAG: hypothetical protein ABSF26_05800 [Thermoguttaceae bacterium]|jgi:hypothetical protein
MPDKKPTTSKPAAIQTIRVGNVIAAIFENSSLSGYRFMSYTLERSFLTSSGRQSRGLGFFAESLEDLIQAATQATAWIRDKQRADAARGDDSH